MRILDSKQIADLKVWDEKGWSPTRALAWTWWMMPKFYRDGNGDRYSITKLDNHAFMWLKEHREDYWKFLKEHNLKKNVYDTYIGKYEPEEKTTW